MLELDPPLFKATLLSFLLSALVLDVPPALPIYSLRNLAVHKLFLFVQPKSEEFATVIEHGVHQLFGVRHAKGSPFPQKTFVI